jgi:hypothetical protein
MIERDGFCGELTGGADGVFRVGAAIIIEQTENQIAVAKARDGGSDALHDAADIAADDGRERWTKAGEHAGADFGIDGIDAGGMDVDEDFVFVKNGDGNLVEAKDARSAEGVEANRFHRLGFWSFLETFCHSRSDVRPLPAYFPLSTPRLVTRSSARKII